MKRLLDVTAAFFGLAILSPVLLLFMLLIFLQDYHSPFYIAPRLRRRGVAFSMIKLRSMVMNADKLGGASTSSSDRRITWVGRTIRRYKLDEFSQLWNVLKGEMSLVGPRPQVQRDVDLYTDEEYRLFEVRPGITDLASIVFADEGEILKGSDNPDLTYNQVIRPWKSRLGLFYVDYHDIGLDIRLIFLTLVGIVSRRFALSAVQKVLISYGADKTLVRIAGRTEPLVPHPPPGSSLIKTRS